MSIIRPPIFPTSQQPAQTQAPARGADRASFFQAAMGAAPATASLQTTAPQPAPQPRQRMPASLPADPPQKILRPGSLLDIRV